VLEALVNIVWSEQPAPGQSFLAFKAAEADTEELHSALLPYKFQTIGIEFVPQPGTYTRVSFGS
jgi:hypothetical protein